MAQEMTGTLSDLVKFNKTIFPHLLWQVIAKSTANLTNNHPLRKVMPDHNTNK